MTPYLHAKFSAKKWGGAPEDYIAIHDWFDETKQYTGDFTHRALRHHSAGIQWAIEKFGNSIVNLQGNHVPVKLIAERHVEEDCGFIPTAQDWLKSLKVKTSENEWMFSVKSKSTKNFTIED